MAQGPVTDDALDRLMAAVALVLDPAHREGVAESLARLLELGAVVGAALPPEAEVPATVFEP
jgi:hypothetical protein